VRPGVGPEFGEAVRKAKHMRVAIAGAGSVGQAIAQKLLASAHKVLLIERHRPSYRPELVPDADWMLADACELGALQAAGADTCDVVIAATGDDKVNLVFSMLCKSEFAVPRVVARVNDPGNQWLFTESWGVDVAVSTPSTLVVAAEQAVGMGDVVRLMTLQHSGGSVVAITLPADSAAAGKPVSELDLPAGTALLALLRDRSAIAALPQVRLQAGDEIVLAAAPGAEAQVRTTFGAPH
jgi:trk system potassium uptake protein